MIDDVIDGAIKEFPMTDYVYIEKSALLPSLSWS